MDAISKIELELVNQLSKEIDKSIINKLFQIDNRNHMKNKIEIFIKKINEFNDKG